jgi:hypothetical protein
MKRSTSQRVPRKLVLRSEAIAVLSPMQLDRVAGASQLRACTVVSNEADCDQVGLD